MEHRGEILEKAVRDKEYSITKLAARIKRSRQHIYNLFARPDINLDEMLKIGKAINHDFKPELQIFKVTEPPPRYRNAEDEVRHWKAKYLKVVEENQKLKEQLNGKKQK